MATPAEKLLGSTLDGGWLVRERRAAEPGATGGNFSLGFFVENDKGRRGFLKALDFLPALQQQGIDPAVVMNSLTEGFIYERNLVSRCRRMDRVVSGIADGIVIIDAIPVQYIIFERADDDVRGFLNKVDHFEIAWLLRSLHHIATGLWQLHSQGIAHQDLKPSNVMVFDAKESKIGDLGRASVNSGKAVSYDQLDISGDPKYAPPELHYREVNPDWNIRRFGCDVYLLGSMLNFFVMGEATTPLIMAEMSPDHWPINWKGNTYRDVLPYVRDAFGRVVERFKTAVPSDLSGPLSKALRELCEPDPLLRGHPADIGRGTSYSLERYHPFFDNLAHRAEMEFARKR